MSGNHDLADATAPARRSRLAILRRPVSYNTVLWSIVVTLIVVVNAVNFFDETGDLFPLRASLFVVFGLLIITVSLSRLLAAQNTAEYVEPPPARRDAARTAKAIVAEPPAPFQTRLANYLHVPESDVLEPRSRWVSSMPFWCAVILPQRSTLAKSVEYIRAVLRRIRATVRGE
jgi:hypothetical protein